MQKLTVILSRDRTSHSAQGRIEKGLACLGARQEVELKIVPHLYDLAPDGPVARYLQSVAGDMVVLAWVYPRAAFWILDANRARGRMGRTSFFPEEELSPGPGGEQRAAGQVPDRRIWCIDLRAQGEVEPLLAEIDRIAAEVTGIPARAAASQEQSPGKVAATNGHARIDEATRPRWYPVVDYGRCGGCLECLNFCLFGVFGIDDAGLLLVEEPDACRDGCPACSRVCPSGAILFPLHNNAAIAGDPKASREALHVELVDFFPGGDAMDQALAERQRALAEQAKANRPQAGTAKDDKPVEKDELDSLVDELDKSDL